MKPPMREKCPYSEFFWSVFFRIRTEYEYRKIRIKKLRKRSARHPYAEEKNDKEG